MSGTALADGELWGARRGNRRSHTFRVIATLRAEAEQTAYGLRAEADALHDRVEKLDRRANALMGALDGMRAAFRAALAMPDPQTREVETPEPEAAKPEAPRAEA
jgi:hypothetical protein